MEDKLIIAILFLLLGFFALVKNIHQQASWKILFFIALMIIGVGFYAFPGITLKSGEQNKAPLFVGVGIVFLAVFLERIFALKNQKWLTWISLLFPFLFLSLGNNLYKIDETYFSGNSLLQIGLLGAIVPFSFHLVFSRLNKIDDVLKMKLELACYSLFLVGGIFATIILGGQFSLFALLVCFFASFTLNNQHKKGGIETGYSVLITLLLLVFLFDFLKGENKMSLPLEHPNVLLGIFTGCFVVLMSSGFYAWRNHLTKSWKNILLIVPILLPIKMILLFNIIYQNSGLTGQESIVSMLLGAGITVLFVNTYLKNQSIAPISILLGSFMLLSPIFTPKKVVVKDEINSNEIPIEAPINLEKDTMQIQVENINDTINQIQKTGLETAIGSWKVNSKKSTLTFVLGAHGEETKGAFTNYSGVFDVEEDITKTKLDITIPVASLTTFLDSRDEGLKEETSFFDLAHFPTITFDVTHFKEIRTNFYVATGTFTMKGISKSVNISFAYIPQNAETFSIKGKGKLDRTLFGMESDASMGDEVSFQFITQFVKSK